MVKSDTYFEQDLSQLVNSAMTRNVFPGMEILVAKGKDILFHDVFGALTPGIKGAELKLNSLFDLASLTKPLATTLAILHLIENKKLALDDLLYRILPGFHQPGARQITVKHLLTHTSGLPDWVALFEPEFNPESGWKKLVNTPLAHKPGEMMIYSCLGFIILGEMVRRLSGESLNDYCQKYLYSPLSLYQLMFNPLSQNLSLDIVPTGFCEVRQQKLVGYVHDENAALFYGEGGNSGLFGTATDIHRLCAMLISKESKELQKIISKNLLMEMFSNQNKFPLTPHALGWDYKTGAADYWSCSHQMPEGSVGHLGFTGTSLWLDPKSKIIILLLSNRVIISREGNIQLMRDFRPKVHSLLLSFFVK